MAARVSVASRVRRWEENPRVGMGESEAGASPGCLQRRLGGSGRAGGGRGVVAVLKQLGGIPPSSLGARGGRRQGEEAGWAGWAVALGAR